MTVLQTDGSPRADVAPVTWVSKQTAMTVSQTYDRQFRKLVESGHIRRRQLPGSRPQFCLEDIQRLQTR